MTISFSGLSSGIDTSSWVEALTSLKNAKVTKLEEEKHEVMAIQDVLANIKSFFNTFKNTIEKVAGPKFGLDTVDLFSKKIAESSNTNILTAFVDKSAQEGTYQINVSQLASTTKASSGFSYITTIVSTTTATNDTKLKDIGVKAGTIKVTNASGVQHDVDITENDTISSFVDKLHDIDVDANYNNKTGVFSINIPKTSIIDPEYTGIVDALHLQNIGNGYTSDTLQVINREEVVSVYDKDTTLQTLSPSSFATPDTTLTFTAESAISGTSTIEVTGATTIEGLVNKLNDADLEASYNNGVLTISGGAVSSGTFDIEGIFGLTSSGTSNYVGGVVTNTTSSQADLSITLGELFSDMGTSDAVSSGYNLVYDGQYLDVSASTTLGELLSKIEDAGGLATINSDGALVVSGGTLTGSVADALGITSVDVTAMLGDMLSIVEEYNATTSTTLSQLGAVGKTNMTVYSSAGNIVGTEEFTSSTTLQDVFNKLEEYDINVTSFRDGVITLDSTNGNVVSGGIVDLLQLSNYNTVLVDGTSQSSTSAVTFTGAAEATTTTSLNDLINSSGITDFTVTVTNNGTSIVNPTGGAFIGSIDVATTDEIAAMTAMSSVNESDNFVNGTTYSVSSVEDLQKLATMVNAGKSTIGTTFVLTKDLDLSGIDDWVSIGQGTDDIANAENAFQGTFDGQGHRIKNLTQDHGNDSNHGLFGKIVNATIKNIGVENVDITGNKGGVLAEFSKSSNIENCFTTGEFHAMNQSGSNWIGGIVGEVVGGSISNTYSGVNISTVDGNTDETGEFGGLIGEVATNPINISNCYATGNVSGGGYANGGLIGNMNAAANVTNSCAIGNAESGSHAGGFIGNFCSGAASSTFTNCYYNNLSNSNVATVDGVNDSCLNSIAKLFVTDGINAIGNMINLNTHGFISDIEQINNSYIEAYKKSEGVMLSSTTGLQISEVGYGTALGEIYNFNPVKPKASGFIANITEIDLSEAVSISEITSLGTDKIYKINSASDLQKFATLVNSGQSGEGCTFVLADDIDMSGIVGWVGIGSGSESFCGIFDGQGHIISNLTASNGLFAQTGLNSIIKNVGINNANITTTEYNAAVLVSDTYKTTIDNCFVKNSTITTSGVTSGGLVGYLDDRGIINNCYADVNISSTNNYVGGLVGYLESNTRISNSFARGNVSTTGDYVGGLCGLIGKDAHNNVFENCYADTYVSGSSTLGGFIGLSNTNVTINNCFVAGSVNQTSTNTSQGLFIGEVYNSNGFVNMNHVGVFVTDSNISNATLIGNYRSTGSSNFTDIVYDSKLSTTMIKTKSAGVSANVPISECAAATITELSTSATNFTTGTTYTISTAAQLQKLATLVNSGKSTTGCNFVLTDDIDMSGAAGFTGIGVMYSTNIFTSTFDGAGHTITGLTTGLFGAIGDNAKIKNIQLIDSNIVTSDSRIGTLVNFYDGDDIIIENCLASGNIKYTGTSSADTSLGGLIGCTTHDNIITIKNCNTNVNINGGGYAETIGGIIAYSRGINISDCNSIGNIKNCDDSVGGIIGVTANANITNCNNYGDISARKNVGGIVGRTTFSDDNILNIDSCISMGKIIGISTIGSIVGRFYCCTQCSIVNSFNNNLENKDLNTFGTIFESNAIVLQDAVNLFDESLAAKENGFISDIEAANLTGAINISSVSESSNFISGKTYKISSVDDLAKLGRMINSGKTGLGCTFVLTDDIDLSAYQAGTGWVSIGDATNHFEGTFDGQGHKVSNLKIANASADCVGLFGYISEDSIIKNIGIENCQISGETYVGSLVGFSYGSITNCYATGTVSGYSNVGGLVGISKNISNSYASVDVTCSSDRVGGLVGFLKSSMSNCYATGDVNATSANRAGGLVGHATSTITNCIATGNIICNSAESSNLVGVTTSTITNSFSTGVLSNGVTTQGPNILILSDTIKDNTIHALSVSDITTSNLKSTNLYTVSTIDDLLALTNLVNSGVNTTGMTFVMTNDIDMSGVSDFHGIGVWSGDRSSVSATFDGSFEGNGYAIKNMTLSGTNQQGLFGQIGENGVVENLKLIDATISGTKYGSGFISAVNNGTISNCSVSGTINADLTATGIGALVGINRGLIENSNVDITAQNIGSNYGGLVSTNSGTITSSFTTGVLENTATKDMSAFVCTNTGNIDNCWSDIDITANLTSNSSSVSGLVSRMQAGSLTNSNYMGEIKDQSSGVGSVGAIAGTANSSAIISNCYYNKFSEAEGVASGTSAQKSGTTGVFASPTSVKLASQGYISDITNWQEKIIVDSTDKRFLSNGKTGFKDDSMISEAYRTGTSNFLTEIDIDTPDIIITNPLELADAINNYSKIGIANGETLLEFAKYVNLGNNCAGKTIVLTEDIDVSSIDFGDHSIGRWGEKVFSGTFNGNGHVIKNFHFSDSEVRCALFGQVHDAVIKNVGLENCDVQGFGTIIGGLVGYADGSSTISNCYTTGNVTNNGASTYTGGLVGYCDGSIINCYSTCTVDGDEKVGGLVGQLDGNAANSFATGNVSGTSRIGGCIGYSRTNITNCYSTGDVTGNSATGGFVGSVNNTYSESISLNITDCISYAQNITYVDADSTGSFIGQVLDTSDGINFHTLNLEGCEAKSTNNVKTVGGCYTYSSTLGITLVDAPAVSNSWLTTVNELGRTLATTDSLYSGSIYTISSKEELAKLATLINGGQTGEGCTFVLTNDIDLSSVPNWTSIGNDANKFKGYLDGQGHKISNLKISNSSNNQGLFGVTDGATIANVEITNANISAQNNVGIVIGKSINTTIANCSAGGEISGTENIGGLVGTMSGTIISCYVAALVDGAENVGGLVGQISKESVSPERISISNAVSIAKFNNTTEDTINGSFIGNISSNAISALDINNCYYDNVSNYLYDKIGGENATEDMLNNIKPMFSDINLLPDTNSDFLIDTNNGNISLGDFIQALNNTGIVNASFSNGQIIINAEEGVGITGDVAGQLGIAGDGQIMQPHSSGVLKTSINGTANLLTKLGNITGYDNGTGKIKVHTQNGDVEIITLNENDTLDSFFDKISEYGLTGSIDASGFVTITGTNNVYLESVVGGSNLLSVLNLSSKNETVVTVQVAGTGVSGQNTYSTTVQANATSKLENLANENGDKIAWDGTGKSSQTITWTDNEDVVHNETIDFYKNQTVADAFRQLANIGINLEFNNQGQVVGTLSSNIKAINVEALKTPGSLFSVLNLSTNGVDKEYTSESLIDSKTTVLNNSTILSDFGITDGDIIINQNDRTRTLTIDSTNTLGDFCNQLSRYGITANVDSQGRMVISGGKDLSFSTPDSGESNILDVLHLNEDNWIHMNNYIGTELTHSTENVSSEDAFENTLLSKFNTDTLKCAGQLAFDVDGDVKAINLNNSDTIGSFIDKINATGLVADFIDGRIKIYDPNGNSVVKNEGATTSSVLELLNITPNADMNMAASDESVKLVDEVVKEQSAANIISGDTKLKVLNITSGYVNAYLGGVLKRINIDAEETFDSLKSKFASAGIDMSIDTNGKLKFKADEVNKDKTCMIGSTSDESNFVSVTGLQAINKFVTQSNRSLYKVNGESKITESGLFVKGDITAGSFMIGNGIIEIDENTTINQLVQKINRSETAEASAFWDDINGQLTITSKKSGSAYINIQKDTTPGAVQTNLTDILGFTGSNSTGDEILVMDRQALGQNAKFSINGVDYTSASNVVGADITRLTGVTINLKNVSNGEVTLKIEKDKEAMANAMEEVVNAYNDLMTNLDKEIAATGTLKNESVLKSIRQQVRSYMMNSLGGTGKFNNLHSIGISTSSASGSNIETTTRAISLLSFDRDKFLNSCDEDLGSVKLLLAGRRDATGQIEQEGIFTHVNNVLDNALRSVNGYFDATNKSLSSKINNINKKITSSKEYIQRYRESLEKRFQSMDLLISHYKDQYNSFVSI